MADPTTRASITLASFNIHMGVDGWGRPYDLTGHCRHLDPDVLVLQENWVPDDGEPSTAGRIAAALGMAVVSEVDLSHGRLHDPHPGADERWGPRLVFAPKALRLDGERWTSTKQRPPRPSVRGQWGIALLSRVPLRDVEVVSLGHLGRDTARRAVIRAVVDLAGGPLVIHGTHMSHITHGSHAQYRLLGAALPDPSTAAVLVGDMNLWGPPVSSYVRGWRRAVTGRTWPAVRPHSQLDHVMVTPRVHVTDARIGGFAGSDHRPVLATLSVI